MRDYLREQLIRSFTLVTGEEGGVLEKGQVKEEKGAGEDSNGHQ